MSKKRKKKDKSDKIIDIYTDLDKEKKVDMTKLERKVTNKKKRIVFFSLLGLFILAIVSIAGFYFFNGRFDDQSKVKAEVAITSPDSLASGEKLDLEITYENKENVSIKSGTISVHYPEGFYFQKADPQPNINNNTWNISNVPAGTAGKIKITGQLVGELQEDKEFTVFLTYQPVNFNSDFQNVDKKIVKITDTIVTLETKLPDRARSGQEVEYKVKFKNTSTLPLPNVKVLVTYPKEFSVVSAEPEASISSNIWQFNEIASNTEQEIKIKGSLKGESKQVAEFKFQLGLEEPSGFFNVQVEKTDQITIINPDLSLKLTAPEFASLGDSIEYKVELENPSDVDINNLEIALDFQNSFFEQSSVTLEKIEKLKAQDKKTLTYQAKIKKNNETDSNIIKTTAKVKSARIAGENVNFEQTATAETKVKANVEFSSQARYYGDDLTKLGSGPIPPKIGETTSYMIWWDIKAKGGDLKNIEIISTLPEYVNKVESSTEDLVFDKKNNQVKWTLSSLLAGENKRGVFNVYITPTQDQKNKLLILTKETVVNVIDSNTNETISVNIEKITSDLPQDPVAKGKGVVE
jgi:uncharacterized repeat protein (TIGR01451 family)